MGGSGIRSAVGAVVGLCSRWEAGNLLQRACGAVELVDCTVEPWRYYTDPVSPATTSDSFYRKSGGLGTSIGPRIRTRAYINVRMHACSEIIKHASSCFHFLARVNFRHPGLCDAAIELARQSLQSLCGGARVLAKLDNDSQQE
jgi:hypothetical protein